MPKAKKLPSGSWRAQVYSHTEPVFENGKPVLDEKTGKQKIKRIYESFTSDDPSSAGRREAELAAAQFAQDKDRRSSKVKLTLGEALDHYIESRSATRSPRTIMDYECTRRNYLQGLMDKQLSKITQDDIQEAINQEAVHLSPKTLRNVHGLTSAVFNQYRPEFTLNTALPPKEKPNLYIPSNEDIKSLIGAARGTELELPILLSAFGPMRRGEICGLYAGDIKDNTVHVTGNMVRYTAKRAVSKNETLMYDGKWLLKRPKSYDGDRFIRYPDYVKNLWGGKSDRIVDLHPDMITDRFGRLIKRIDLPHFRFHDLRHYSASIQHALGIKDAYIMSRGGWGNDRVLKEVYRHTLDDKQEEMDQIANRYFTELSRERADVSIALPADYDRNEYIDLLYECCGYVLQHNLQHPNDEIKNFDQLLTAILDDYELNDLANIKEKLLKESIHAYELENKQIFLNWIVRWLDTIKEFS